MTTEKRVLIEPKDILGIEYECSHCGARSYVTIAKFDRQIYQCPNCLERLFTRDEGADDKATRALVETLQAFDGLETVAKIRLHIDAETGAE